MSNEGMVAKSELEFKQRTFLEGVRAKGTIAAGRRAAEVARHEVEKWRRKPEFEAQYQQAVVEHRELLEELMMVLIERGEWAPLRFKLQAELPEKYGERWQRGSGESDADAVWRELERAALEAGPVLSMEGKRRGRRGRRRGRGQYGDKRWWGRAGVGDGRTPGRGQTFSHD